jgi:TM2 domain-containing membrane protein YozV
MAAIITPGRKIDDIEWYYEEHGERKGPVSSDVLLLLINAERVTYGSWVWRKGFPEWLKVENTEMAGNLHAKSPPPMYRGGKSKVAAGMFAIFLGCVGTHRFYIGEIGMGILYLVFCWTGIPALAGFIEGIIYLTMSDEAWDVKMSQLRQRV